MNAKELFNKLYYKVEKTYNCQKVTRSVLWGFFSCS